MSLFKKSKQNLTIVGIRVVPKQNLPSVLQNCQSTINRIQILSLSFLIGTYFVTIFCTMIFKDVGFSEMSQAVLYCIIGFVHSSFCYISMWKRQTIMAYMDDLEKIIERSMTKKVGKNRWFQNKIFVYFIGSENPRARVIYKQSSEMADMFSDFVCISMYANASLFIIPAVTISYYNYFVLGEMQEALQMPIPSM